MSCRAEFFQKQVQQILNTWGARLPENFDIMYYDGDWMEEGIEGNHIKCSTHDNIETTFVKTVAAINSVLKNGYDYILRINTSTWVNVPLLNKFIQEMAEDDKIYAPELYSLSEAPAPLPCDLYARGNFILIPIKLAHILCKYSIFQIHTKMVDDVAIGNILNSYWALQYRNPFDYVNHIKGLPFGWYKASPEKFNLGHQLCCFGEDRKEPEFYNRFIAVQTKQYRRRDGELDNMLEFDNMMKDAGEPSLDLCKSYMDDPSVFIGSILGYINYSIWKSTPKHKLLYFEQTHKAIDDKENPNYSKEEYDKLHKF